MSREPEQSDDPSAASDKVLDDDELRAFVEQSVSLQRLALEEKFGPDVRLLAEDDDKLLTYLQSEDLSLKRVALLCLLYFHNVYHNGIVREAADYIVNGDDIQIRSLCVRYLGTSHNEEITSILRDCANKIGSAAARPGDDQVRRIVDSYLELVIHGPRPFAEIASMAEEILARLHAANDRNDSAGDGDGDNGNALI